MRRRKAAVEGHHLPPAAMGNRMFREKRDTPTIVSTITAISAAVLLRAIPAKRQYTLAT